MTGDDDQSPLDPYENAYEAIAARLETRIKGGEFGYHMPLPSEPRLADWYGVSRATIRRAADLLIERGLVERRRGKGTFVIWREGVLNAP